MRILLMALLIIVHSQTAISITPSNAGQLTELGRANFLLDPLIATDGLALSPDGQTLAVGTLDGLYLVEVSELLARGTLPAPIGSEATILEPTYHFQQPAFSSDGQWLIALEGVQRRPATLFTWDLTTLETRFGPFIPPGHYQSLVFRPNTNEAYYSNFVDPFRFTDPENIVPTGALSYFYLGVPGNVSFLIFEEADQQFFVRGFDPSGSRMHYLVRDLNTNETSHHFWDFEAAAEIAPLFTGSAEAVPSPDWRTVVDIDPGTVPAFLLHDLATGGASRITVTADVLSQPFIFSPDSQLVAGTTFTGGASSLRLWDAHTGEQVAVIGLGEYYVHDILFSADMTRLMARIAPSMPLTAEPEQLVVWSIP